MTDTELNRLMAEVFGVIPRKEYSALMDYSQCPFIVEFEGTFYLKADAKSGLTRWQPVIRIEQAMMVLEAKYDNWALHRFPLASSEFQYECVIYFTPRSLQGHHCCGTTHTKEFAICLAVEAALEEMEA